MHKRSSYDVPYYILAFVLSIVIWVVSFRLLHYPKANECLYLFYAGSVNDYKIEQEIKDDINDEKLRKVSIMSCDISLNVFPSKYQAMGLTKCDVCLVPYGVIETTDCENSFVDISSLITYDGEYFKQNDVNYGIVIKEETKTKLSAYFNFSDESYVLAVTCTSVNGGEMTSNAIKMVEWILK